MRVVCGNCGAEVELPKTSKFILGKTISEQGDGTVVMNMKKKEKKSMQSAESRKATLEINGVATDGFFALTLPNGKQIKVDQDGNKVDDATISEVVGGNIGNKKLYRRWVMAQWFRQYNGGYSDAISRLTLRYQWKMISEELKTLARLEREDREYFEERTHFFNIQSITRMLYEYVDELRTTTDKAKKHHCKGVDYIKIGGQDVFCTDIDKKILNPIIKAADKFNRSRDYAQASKEFEHIRTAYLRKYRTARPYAGATFKDAYKGSGAYYTLQNMVLYHGCFLNEYRSGNVRQYKATHKGMDAYEFMKSLLNEYQGEGWRWTGVLRQCIKDNHFEFTCAI